MLITATLVVLSLLAAWPLAASPPDLILPIACELGRSCWILRYVDHQPGPGAKDYRCGGLTGDDHKGTDFAVRDLADASGGVDVLAAAPGRVLAVRDGMPDVEFHPDDQAAIGGRECGNGVRLSHGDGWTTMYCHLRRGSIAVEEGDHVQAGAILGQVGLSGQTSFPHVHFDLRHEERVIDPFASEPAPRCNGEASSFWKPGAITGQDRDPPFLTNIGIAATSPEHEDVRHGRHRADRLPLASPALILWVDGYWFDSSDQVHFLLKDPRGQPVVDRRLDAKTARQSWFSFAGAPRPASGWRAGRYQGTVTVKRPGRADVILGHAIELR